MTREWADAIRHPIRAFRRWRERRRFYKECRDFPTTPLEDAVDALTWPNDGQDAP